MKCMNLMIILLLIITSQLHSEVKLLKPKTTEECRLAGEGSLASKAIIVGFRDINYRGGDFFPMFLLNGELLKKTDGKEILDVDILYEVKTGEKYKIKTRVSATGATPGSEIYPKFCNYEATIELPQQKVKTGFAPIESIYASDHNLKILEPTELDEQRLSSFWKTYTEIENIHNPMPRLFAVSDLNRNEMDEFWVISNAPCGESQWIYESTEQNSLRVINVLSWPC